MSVRFPEPVRGEFGKETESFLAAAGLGQGKKTGQPVGQPLGDGIEQQFVMAGFGSGLAAEMNAQHPWLVDPGKNGRE